MGKLRLFTVSIISVVMISTVVEGFQNSSENLPQVHLRNTEVRTINSKFVDGMEYKIYVALPEGYEKSSQKYPVFYFTDAWFLFGAFTQIYQELEWAQEVPQLILVGISWEGGSDDAFYNRSRDFTPTMVPKEKLPPGVARWIPISGGASNFIRFMEEELFPMIESEYRVVKTDRAIYGGSLGGLLMAHLLFARPELFQRYSIVSPYLPWDNDLIFHEEAAYAKEHTELNATVFLCVGSEETASMISNWARFRSTLAHRNYKGLKLIPHIFDQETHGSIWGVAFSRSLRILYEN